MRARQELRNHEILTLGTLKKQSACRSNWLGDRLQSKKITTFQAPHSNQLNPFHLALPRLHANPGSL